ncbi:hypothetical protein [Embleya sp. NPDC020886]|uniref:hypothetical protein n=1 Tax=Embleya sp. NPDC020886 TaxID=3363980 RepID=UPI00378D8822
MALADGDRPPESTRALWPEGIRIASVDGPKHHTYQDKDSADKWRAGQAPRGAIDVP